MSELKILIIILIFITIYLMVEMSKAKKRLVKLIQENAVIWQFIREKEDK